MKLTEAFEKFKQIPFPDNSASSEELSDIFYDLVTYDSYVASQVDNCLVGKEPSKLNYEPILEERLNRFLLNVNSNEPDFNSASEMLVYVKELKKLLEIANKER